MAPSEKEARALLRERAVYPLWVKRSRPFTLSLANVWRFGREPRLSIKELAMFTRQLATLLQATIPYDAALGIIQQESANAVTKSVLADVRDRVMGGSYLADALGAYPRYFPPLVINMVRSGEASGTLVMILGRLADYFDNASRLRTRITSALIYPLFMVLFSAGVVSFMITYIIPKITALFENFGATLPLPTRILIALSGAMTHYWWLILMALVGMGWGLTWFVRTERGAMLVDRWELRVPLWRDLRRKMILQRLAQTLGTMLRSGVELKDALQVSSEVMENQVYLKAMERVIFDVQNRGAPLAVAMRRVTIFPEDLCQMVAIGEETATLDAMLENVSNRLSYEVTATMDAATALFEPVMILVMGAVVGFIVISILLPMLQLNQLVG